MLITFPGLRIDLPSISRRTAVQRLAVLSGVDFLRRIHTGLLASDLSREHPPRSDGTVDVRDFGARGDGVTDDTRAIQTALSSARHVTVSAGTYRTTRTLTVPSGVIIEGASREVSTLIAASGTEHALLTVESGSDVSVVRLALDGARTHRHAGHLLALARSARIEVSECALRAAPEYACWAYAVERLTIRDSVFDECQNDIYVDGAGAAGTQIERNRAAHGKLPSRYGFLIFGVQGAVIADNVITDLGKHHVGDTDYRSGLFANGIFLFRATGTIVRDNLIVRPYWSGLVIGEHAVDTVCVNNYFECGQLAYGPAATSVAAWIEQAGCRVVQFRGNRLRGGLSVGDGGGAELTVTGNIIRTPGRGIDIGPGARDSRFLGNDVAQLGDERTEYGAFVWDHTAATRQLLIQRNSIRGFGVGVAINTTGAVGTVRGLAVLDNALQGNTRAIAKPKSVVLGDDCAIRGNRPTNAVASL